MESREHEFERTWQPRLWFSIGLLILLAGYLIAFVVGNSDEASVNFIFAEARTSLIWVILLSVLVGLIAGVLLSQVHRRRQAFKSEPVASEGYSSDASSETPSSIDEVDS